MVQAKKQFFICGARANFVVDRPLARLYSLFKTLCLSLLCSNCNQYYYFK